MHRYEVDEKYYNERLAEGAQLQAIHKAARQAKEAEEAEEAAKIVEAEKLAVKASKREKALKKLEVELKIDGSPAMTGEKRGPVKYLRSQDGKWWSTTDDTVPEWAERVQWKEDGVDISEAEALERLRQIKGE